VRDRVAYRVSLALAVVVTIVGVLSFTFWGVFDGDAPTLIGNLRGTVLVLVVVGMPTLITSMALTRRGSLRARFVWLGVLGYVGYNAVLLCFLPSFNSFFLVFTGVLSLAVWSLMLLVPTFDRALVAERAVHVPVRGLAVYLWVSAAAFATLWLADIVPAIVNHGQPSSLEELGLSVNAIWVLDFAFSFPFMVLGGIWLWQRRGWGYVLGGAMVIMLTIETAGVAVDQVFGHVHDPSAPLAQVWVLAGATVAGLVASIAFVRGIAGVPADAEDERSDVAGRDALRTA
jgi:hypothetical protein